eukprot:2521613-Pleurochrysis_carterae.AAC.4
MSPTRPPHAQTDGALHISRRFGSFSGAIELLSRIRFASGSLSVLAQVPPPHPLLSPLPTRTPAPSQRGGRMPVQSRSPALPERCPSPSSELNNRRVVLEVLLQNRPVAQR